MEMHFNLMWKLLGLVVTYFVGAKCESGKNIFRSLLFSVMWHIHRVDKKY